jgi:hypothetical protein
MPLRGRRQEANLGWELPAEADELGHLHDGAVALHHSLGLAGGPPRIRKRAEVIGLRHCHELADRVSVRCGEKVLAGACGSERERVVELRYTVEQLCSVFLVARIEDQGARFRVLDDERVIRH